MYREARSAELQRSTIGLLAASIGIFGGLFLLLTGGTALDKPVALPQRCIGKLLSWSVQGGMSRDRVKQIFGEPEMTDSIGRGLIGGDVYTSTWDTYLRFGVTVNYFESGSPFEDREQMEYDRIEGGIG